MLTEWTWREKPQEDRRWYVGGSYGGRKGVLEWCDSRGDAIRTMRAMMVATKSKYDIKLGNITRPKG